MLASGVSPVQIEVARRRRRSRTRQRDSPAGSNNDLDLMEEMDLAAKLQKITKMDPLALNAKAVVDMATIEGAEEPIHMEKEIGSLEAGKKADIILIWIRRTRTPCQFTTLLRAARIRA